MHETTVPEDAQDLEPLEPSAALDMYLESRATELADRSLELYREHISNFVEWCDGRGIIDMREVSARTLQEYRVDIAGDVARSTLSIALSTVRRFVAYCESAGAVAPGTAEKFELPNRDRASRSEMLEADDAEEILTYLRRYHYASRAHALMALLWHAGLRTGTARALDVPDLEEERDRLRVRHRPETGTPLKNGEDAERFVALSPDVSEALADYAEEHRHDVTDDHGRQPLFTTRHGRPAKNSIRRTVYAATRPCSTGRGCPHGREPESCDAAQRSNDACKCPSTVSGHPVRRGAITHFLRSDVPENAVSDRMDVSRDVLDEHYDRRTEDEKAEQRRAFLDNV